MLYPLPVGVWVRGVLVGGVTALVALGMALIYRSNRIVNFAQGDLGAAPAVLVFLLLTEWGWPYPLAVAAGALAAFALGGLVELAVIRRFFRAPRLVLTVATIGLAQLLTGIALFLPRWFGVEDSLLAPRIEDPFDVRFEIGGTIFRGNSVIALVVTPLPVLGLVVFLRGTRLGDRHPGLRRPRRPRRPARRPGEAPADPGVGVAALLAFTATFLRAGILGLPVGSVLSLGILLRVADRAAAGRAGPPARHRRHRRRTRASSSSGIDWHQGETLPLLGIEMPPLDAVLAVVVLVALLRRRRGRRRSRHRRPVVAGRRPTRSGRSRSSCAGCPRSAGSASPVGALLAAVALALPHVLRRRPLAEGVGGADLRHPRHVDRGAHRLGGPGVARPGGLLRHRRGDGGEARPTRGTSTSSSPSLAAGAVGAVAAVLVGLPALRYRGLYLAVTTFAFALATTALPAEPRVLRLGPEPADRAPPAASARIDIDSPTRIYYVMLAGLAAGPRRAAGRAPQPHRPGAASPCATTSGAPRPTAST